MSLFATRGRQDRRVPLAGVTGNGGSVRGRPVLLHHLGVVCLLRLVVFPYGVALLPVLPVPVAHLPVLVFTLFFPVEVRA